MIENNQAEELPENEEIEIEIVPARFYPSVMYQAHCYRQARELVRYKGLST